MKELKNVVLKLLAKTHNLSEAKVAKLIFPKLDDSEDLDFTKIIPSALTELLDLDAERVTTIKTSIDKTETYTKAYDKAKVEVLGKAEKTLAAAYGLDYVEGKTKLDKLVKTIVAQESKATKTGELTDDNIKKSQLYIALETANTQTVADLTTAHDLAFKTLSDTHTKNETLVGVMDNALGFFKAMNPILSKDGAKATNQEKVFLKNFKGYDYEKQADGSHILVGKDGKRLEDKHGHAVTLKQKVSELANDSYDFKVQDDKGGTGDKGDKGGQRAKTTHTDAEKAAYQSAIFEAPTVEAREKLTAAFESGE